MPGAARPSMRAAAVTGRHCLPADDACASSPLLRQQCYNPDAQLAEVLPPFEAARAKGCGAGRAQPEGSDCDRLAREIERLGVVCPAHAPTLMANAVIAYDDHRPAESQQFLDLILSQPRGYPGRGGPPGADRHRRRQRAVCEASARAADQARARSLGPARDVRRCAVPGWKHARGEERADDGGRARRAPMACRVSPRAARGSRLDEATMRAACMPKRSPGNPGWAPAESRLKALRARAAPPR